MFQKYFLGLIKIAHCIGLRFVQISVKFLRFYTSLPLHLLYFTDKKHLKTYGLTIGIVLLGCKIYRDPAKGFNVLMMSKREFDEISKISINDERGFKYIKSSLKKNVFSSISSTTKTQEISKEEHEKLVQLLRKY